MELNSAELCQERKCFSLMQMIFETRKVDFQPLKDSANHATDTRKW